METLLGSPPTTLLRPSLLYDCKPKKIATLKAKINGEYDPLLQAAINAASLRFQETHRPQPLFMDPYVGCFVDPDLQMDLRKYSHHHCLATKFIDDKLLRTTHHIDGIKQLVLLTDGMDTRPYRLNWPTSTIIFDVSPEKIFQKSNQKLQAVGAKIPRFCMLFHIPLDLSNLQPSLRSKGFIGYQPSIWAIQGLPLLNLSNFEDILLLISCMAAKGSLFLGEIPAWLADTEINVKSSREKWLNKLFMNNGFRVEMISYDKFARSLGKEVTPEDNGNILFVAEQLRFSDDQMENWRRELQRVDDEGDEEGFEEL